MAADTKYKSLKVLFETDSIHKMSEIIELFPSKIAEDLNINYSRFAKKLYKPEQFSVKEIIRFAQLIDVSPQLIAKVIIANAEANMTKK